MRDRLQHQIVTGKLKPNHWLVAAFAVVLFVSLAWAFLWPFALPVDANEVQAAEVRLEPSGRDEHVPPPAVTSDPTAIAALVAVIRSGTVSSDHKCADRGVITPRRSTGDPLEVRVLPGHDPQWYELRYDGSVYRVPRARFVAATQQLGVTVPLECH